MVPHMKHLWVSKACYEKSFTFLYADDLRTSQEAHLRASTAFYKDNFTFLYVDDNRTSQESHLWASTASCRDDFSFYTQMMFVPHRKHTYGPTRLVSGIALHVDM
jgi:hypothetical protein